VPQKPHDTQFCPFPLQSFGLVIAGVNLRERNTKLVFPVTIRGLINQQFIKISNEITYIETKNIVDRGPIASFYLVSKSPSQAAQPCCKNESCGGPIGDAGVSVLNKVVKN
jgi:hypothetical protein